MIGTCFRLIHSANIHTHNLRMEIGEAGFGGG
jgi:hypothetical protein